MICPLRSVLLLIYEEKQEELFCALHLLRKSTYSVCVMMSSDNAHQEPISHKLTKTHYCAFCLVILIPEVAKQHHNQTTHTFITSSVATAMNKCVTHHSTRKGVHYYWCTCCLQLGPICESHTLLARARIIITINHNHSHPRLLV